MEGQQIFACVALVLTACVVAFFIGPPFLRDLKTILREKLDDWREVLGK